MSGVSDSLSQAILERCVTKKDLVTCFCFLFSCYSHQSISDYSWEVYIVHSGVFAG